MANRLNIIIFWIKKPVGSFISWLSFALGIVLYIFPCSFFIRLVVKDKEKSRLLILQIIRKIILLPVRLAPYVSFHTENLVNETFKKQAIYICNHNSFFDILACLSLCDKLTILIKSSYKKNFFVRSVAKIAGYHFTCTDPFHLYDELAEDIEKGYSVLIFPEGTRTQNGQIEHFSSGAFTLARYFNIDILPILSCGFEKVLPKGKILATPGEVKLIILQRISPIDPKIVSKPVKQHSRLFETYYSELKKTKTAVCIIGGGMGGLFTGAILANIGYQVTVLEKNTIIGGGLQSFKQYDETFNTGMHNFGGWEGNWLLAHLLQFLGIKSKLAVLATQQDAQDIVWTDINHSYRLPKGRKNFETYLATLFPEQQQGLQDYLETIYLIANSFDHFMMRPPSPHPEVKQYESLTVEQLLRTYIHDEELIKLLSYFSILCGGNIATLPVSIYSMMTTLYISGEYRFVDNAQQLANALSEIIWQKGGMVINNTYVNRVQIENNHATLVQSEDGRQWKPDIVVSAIPPKPFLSIISGEIMKNVTKKRINTFGSECSVLIIYIKLKEHLFPFINSTIFVPVEKVNPLLPNYILLSTPPHQAQNEWARTMEILVPIQYSHFEKWSNSTPKHRGIEYDTYKIKLVESIIDYLSLYYPIKMACDKVFSATPLTIRDFYNNPRGAIFAQQGLYLPIQTRTDNVYMTGQSILFHGLCGVPITAVMTAEIISGMDVLSLIRNTEK